MSSACRLHLTTPIDRSHVAARVVRRRFVVFLSGLAHITLPNSTDEAWVQGGRNGLIIATDTAALSTGHITEYPSGDETLALQIPTADGKVPGHILVHSGPCEPKFQIARRGLDELD